MNRSRTGPDVGRSRASVGSSTRPPVASYGPGATSVPHLASRAILQGADAITAEEIGPTSAESVRAKIEHDEFIESLGG